MKDFGMKGFKWHVALFCALAAVFCFATPSMAAQAKTKQPQDVFAVDLKREGWTLKSGGDPEGTSGASLELGVYWYVVNPEVDEAAKGLKAGLLLFDVGTKKYSFLPLEEEEIGVEGVQFSPDKKRMIVASSMNRYATSLTVYDLETLDPQATFMGYSEVYFVDDVRFAFTLFDENVERPTEAGMWGTSAAFFAPDAEDGYIVLKEATAKESFAVVGADENQITIHTTTVKSEKDWEDADKWQESEITVEVPPAG